MRSCFGFKRSSGVHPHVYDPCGRSWCQEAQALLGALLGVFVVAARGRSRHPSGSLHSYVFDHVMVPCLLLYCQSLTSPPRIRICPRSYETSGLLSPGRVLRLCATVQHGVLAHLIPSACRGAGAGNNATIGAISDALVNSPRILGPGLPHWRALHRAGINVSTDGHDCCTIGSLVKANSACYRESQCLRRRMSIACDALGSPIG